MDTIINLPVPTAEESSLRELFRKCARALLEPARFFRQDLPRMSLTEALAFGMGNAWAAAVLAFFVQTINSLLLSRLLEGWMQRLVASEEGFKVWGLSADSFLFTAGMLLLGPFLFLLRAYLFAATLFLFARLLIEDRPGAPEPVTFEGALRIQSVVLCARWFTLVPLFGGVLSFVVGLVLAVTGVRERFGVSNRRATAVVLAPYLLLLLAALVVGAVLLVALTQIPLQELLDLE